MSFGGGGGAFFSLRVGRRARARASRPRSRRTVDASRRWLFTLPRFFESLLCLGLEPRAAVAAEGAFFFPPMVMMGKRGGCAAEGGRVREGSSVG